jgi:cyclopropane fatty-acyl-phospholipid synthase-like methyltransferase
MDRSESRVTASDDAGLDAPTQHGYELPYHWCMSPFHKYIVECAVQRVVSLVRGRSVLEAGCGDGFVTSLLAREARSVLGFDLNERALAFARLLVPRPNVEFAQGRASEVLRFADRIQEEPEVIAAFELVEHLASQELDDFLAGSRDVLGKTRGSLVITTPNRHRQRRARHNPHHAKEFTPQQLTHELHRAGFHKVHISGLYLQPLWQRLEHFANTVPFRAAFRALVRGGSSRPDLCRTLVAVAQVGP